MASKIRQFVEYARTLANNVTSSNQINADLLDNKDSTYYAPASHTHSYQAADGDLLAIAGLTGTSGFLKKTAVDTWALDTNTYLTSISSSDVTTALGYTPYNSTNPSGYITSSGSITGSSASCTGNADTATKLATARTIELSGDVSGSVSFDGSVNATITTTVADDSHNHIIGNVDGLQTALDGKQALGSYLTAVPAATSSTYGGLKVSLSGTTLTITV